MATRNRTPLDRKYPPSAMSVSRSFVPLRPFDLFQFRRRTGDRAREPFASQAIGPTPLSARRARASCNCPPKHFNGIQKETKNSYLKFLRQQKEACSRCSIKVPDGFDLEMNLNGIRTELNQNDFGDVGFNERQMSKRKKARHSRSRGKGRSHRL